MINILGIAIELFEYNRRWKSAVLFLFFFTVSTVTISLMQTPKQEITSKDNNKALTIIADKLGVSDKTVDSAKSIIDKAKTTYRKIVDKESKIKTNKIDVEIKKDDNLEPTTLDVLNEL